MAAVQVVVDEKLAENALTQGNFIHQRMTEIRQRFSFMTDFRGRGLFLAMEYAPLIRLDKKYKKSALEFNLRMCEEGLLSQVTKENKIRITPPLVITRSLAEEIVEKLEKIMKTF